MRKPAGSVSALDVQAAGLEGSRKGDAPGPERDDEMVALVADGWTYEAIGCLYGFTRERARQIVIRRTVRDTGTTSV